MNITYASVNEIGFDVLRDQLVTDVADLVSPNPDAVSYTHLTLPTILRV